MSQNCNFFKVLHELIESLWKEFWAKLPVWQSSTRKKNQLWKFFEFFLGVRIVFLGLAVLVIIVKGVCPRLLSLLSLVKMAFICTLKIPSIWVINYTSSFYNKNNWYIIIVWQNLVIPTIVFTYVLGSSSHPLVC